MERVDREGLCQEASVDIFLTWYTFGGIQKGLSLDEIIRMPLWLRKDFRFILAMMSTRRRERKHAEAAFAELDIAPKKGKSRARRNRTGR